MKPSWMKGQIITNYLNDESDYFQYGQEAKETFYTFKLPPPSPSSWIYYPTEEQPSTLYKFTSIEINFTLDQKVWTRSTYSVLDWFGDLGGLFDALVHLAGIFISPLSVFALKSSLLTSIFRYNKIKKFNDSSPGK